MEGAIGKIGYREKSWGEDVCPWIQLFHVLHEECEVCSLYSRVGCIFYINQLCVIILIRSTFSTNDCQYTAKLFMSSNLWGIVCMQHNVCNIAQAG